jgi:hypothetical protein
MSQTQHAEVQAPVIDRRGTARAATVFTIGKIGFDQSSRPCMVRDISTGGMRIQMTNLPPVGAPVEIEMRGMAARRAIVRWVAGREAGLAFDHPCDLAGIFEARLSRSGQRARPPRFDLRHRIELLVGGRSIAAEIVNVSVGGARLIVSEAVKPGSHGVVQLDLDLAFDRIAGVVRWVEGETCGFHFSRPISSLSLALALEAWEAGA